VQIRGFPVRIPLDLLLVFTANPEDYTNRGSIITPLKDRIASQILTHYPKKIEDALTITEEEAWTRRDDGMPPVVLPEFMAHILEEIAFGGRDSEYIDQKSGVSARLPIAAREILISQVERRLIRDPAAAPCPRIIDLAQVAPAITGKVELVYEGEQEGPAKVARHLIATACRVIFDRHFPDVIREGAEPKLKSDRYKPVLDWFAKGNRVELYEDMSDEDYRSALDSVPGLQKLAAKFLPTRDGAEEAAVMELVLEGLHAHSLLAKEDLIGKSSYTDMLGVMLEEFQ
jgi:magnesium chelatase subunit I